MIAGVFLIGFALGWGSARFRGWCDRLRTEEEQQRWVLGRGMVGW